MLEKEIERRVCAYARKRGLLVYKFNSPAHVGVPDRLFLGPNGEHFFIEFKRERGKITPLQRREISHMTKAKHIVFVVDNVAIGTAVIDAMVDGIAAGTGVLDALAVEQP